MTARHSTLTKRCLVVEAGSDDAAVGLFLAANGVAPSVIAARTPILRGARNSAPRCTALGGTVTITVELADEDCIPDLPEAPASSPRVENGAARRSQREIEYDARRLPGAVNTDAVP